MVGILERETFPNATQYLCQPNLRSLAISAPTLDGDEQTSRYLRPTPKFSGSPAAFSGANRFHTSGKADPNAFVTIGAGENGHDIGPKPLGFFQYFAA
jgi:hypothetical protein